MAQGTVPQITAGIEKLVVPGEQFGGRASTQPVAHRGTGTVGVVQVVVPPFDQTEQGHGPDPLFLAAAIGEVVPQQDFRLFAGFVALNSGQGAYDVAAVVTQGVGEVGITGGVGRHGRRGGHPAEFVGAFEVVVDHVAREEPARVGQIAGPVPAVDRPAGDATLGGEAAAVGIEQRIGLHAVDQVRRAIQGRAGADRRDVEDDRIAGIVAQRDGLRDVARHVEAAPARARISMVDGAAFGEGVLRPVHLARAEGRAVMIKAQESHVVEVRRRRGVVARPPERIHLLHEQENLHVGAPGFEQVGHHLVVTAVFRPTVVYPTSAAPVGRGQVVRVAGGHRAHTPAIEDERRVRVDQPVHVDVELEHATQLVRVLPGDGRRENPVVDLVVVAGQSAVWIDDPAVGPVAPVDARRAARTRHDDPIVDEQRLRTAVAEARIEFLQVVHDLGEIAHVAARFRPPVFGDGALEVVEGDDLVVEVHGQIVHLYRAHTGEAAVFIGPDLVRGEFPAQVDLVLVRADQVVGRHGEGLVDG